MTPEGQQMLIAALADVHSSLPSLSEDITDYQTAYALLRRLRQSIYFDEGSSAGWDVLRRASNHLTRRIDDLLRN